VARQLNNWLESYLEYTMEHEAVERFHKWIGLWVLSSVSRRAVWLPRGYYQLYPNLYVVLVAESALSRKSAACRIGRNVLVQMDNPPLITGPKITPEKMINKLKVVGEDHIDSFAVVFAPELGVFLGQRNQSHDIMAILTDIFDCQEEPWHYELLMRGDEVLERVGASLLGGTTPEWMKTSLPTAAVGGGFTSRIIFVYARGRRHAKARPENSEMFQSGESLRMRTALAADLNELAFLKGPFTYGESAGEWFDSWYLTIEDTHQIGMGGYIGRKHAMVLKVAMLLSLSESSSLVIEQPHLKEAVTLIEENEGPLAEILTILSATGVGESQIRVLECIKRNEEIDHSDLMRNFSWSMKAVEMSETLKTLIDAGCIEMLRVPTSTNRSKMRYRYLKGI